MREILDASDPVEPTSNYRKWAFRFLLYILFANACQFYLTINFVPGIHDPEVFSSNMNILSVIGIIMFVVGIVFFILAVKNNEEKNYQFIISAIGYSISILFSLLILIGNLLLR